MANYRIHSQDADGTYLGQAVHGDTPVRITLDAHTRTLRVRTGEEAPRTYHIPSHRWHPYQHRDIKLIGFSHHREDEQLLGLLVIRPERVSGWLHRRQGRPWQARYRLSAAPATEPSPPARIFYIHTDHLGTPQRITNAQQSLVWQADYAPFGQATLTTATLDNPLRFPGQYFDPHTGLHYNYFRDYDPGTGRYIASDPIGLRGGINTYGYVDSNPVRSIDPLGLVKWTGEMSTIAVIYGGGATRMTFDLTSECVNGKRARVKVLAGGFSVGAGANASATSGQITFEDKRSEVSPFVFRGPAKFVGVGIAIWAEASGPGTRET